MGIAWFCYLLSILLYRFKQTGDVMDCSVGSYVGCVKNVLRFDANMGQSAFSFLCAAFFQTGIKVSWNGQHSLRYYPYFSLWIGDQGMFEIGIGICVHFYHELHNAGRYCHRGLSLLRDQDMPHKGL